MTVKEIQEELQEALDALDDAPELSRERLLLFNRRKRLMEELFLAAFEESPLVRVDLPGDRTRYLFLHQSSKKAGHWQVSAFYSDGPFTDVVRSSREQAIREVPEMIVWPTEPDLVAPMDPADFEAITETEEWHKGVLSLRYATLENLLRYRFGHGDEVMAVIADSRGAESLEEAVQVLEAGIRVLEKRRS